jgi:hypothetical protein
MKVLQERKYIKQQFQYKMCINIRMYIHFIFRLVLYTRFIYLLLVFVVGILYNFLMNTRCSMV